MNKYTEATKRPYGYLFIDLKQNTPEEDRLKTDVFENTPEEDRLKTDVFDSVPDNKRCSPNMVGGRVEEYINRDTPEDSQLEDRRTSEQTYLLNQPEEKMPSCDDCGLVFESVPDLARHMNRWCPENNDLKRQRDEDDVMPSKKPRLEEQTIIDDGEDVAFTKLAELAREANEDKWESKFDKYVKDGVTEEEARLKANRKLNDEDLDQLMSR